MKKKVSRERLSCFPHAVRKKVNGKFSCFPRIARKRGISAVVATVLIILITVAAITIVWAAIIPMIKNDLEFSELEGRVQIVTSGGWTVYDAERGIAIVQVKRDVDDLEMKGIRIIFSINGSSYGSSVAAPEPGETRAYTFNLSDYGRPESVSVVPIFVVGKLEKEGGVTSDVEISSGKIYEIDGFVYELEEDYMSEDYYLSCLCDETGQDYETYTYDGDVVYVDCWNDRCWTETAGITYAWEGMGIDEPTDSCVGVADRSACNYCEDLDYGGFNDWELPVQDDLNDLKHSDSCSGTCFGGEGLIGRYWSSTEMDANNARYVGFSGFHMGGYGKDHFYSVRCVRG